MKTQGLGLATVYKNSDHETWKWLKLSFGMGFLNLQSVEDCFVFDIYPDAPEYVCRLRRELHTYIFTRDMATLTVNVPHMVVKVSTERVW